MAKRRRVRGVVGPGCVGEGGGEKLKTSSERGTEEAAASPTSGGSRQIPGETEGGREQEK